jgi:hypothetical protein
MLATLSWEISVREKRWRASGSIWITLQQRKVNRTMGLMKRLRTFIRSKKPAHNKGNSYRLAGSHGAKILEEMIKGQWVGARDACVIIKSHKRQTRLQEMRKMLRRNSIAYFQKWAVTRNGRKFKQWQIIPSQREAARKLIVGKGAMDKIGEALGILIIGLFIILVCTPVGWALVLVAGLKLILG